MDPSPLQLFVGYALCGVLPLFLVPFVRRHWSKPGSTGMIVTISGLGIWGIFLGVLHYTNNHDVSLVAATFVLFGSQLGGIGYLLIATEHTGVLEPTRRVLATFAIPVLIVQAMALTDPFHHLVWADLSPVTVGQLGYGPVYTLHRVVAYGTALVGLLLLASEALTSQGVQRRQSVALVGAGVPPVILAAFGSFVLTDVSYSLAPFGFTVTAFVYAWALFRTDFLEVVPVGRRRIVEEMDDAAITLDGDDRVIDANPAARRLVGVEADATGVPVEEYFADLPGAVQRLRDADGVDTEFSVVECGAPRHYHLKTSSIRTDGGGRGGRLIVLRDITPIKRRERALEEREQQLDLLRQVLSRALRHNIRNELTVVRGYADAIAVASDDQSAALAESIVAKCDDLTDLSSKAATIERLVEQGESTETLDLGDVLEDVVERYQLAYPSIAFSIEIPDSCVVETTPSLEFVFDNLIENAVEHGSVNSRSVTPEPAGTNADEVADVQGIGSSQSQAEDTESDCERPATVRVSLSCDDSWATVTVADDGPGIPEHELSVLERGEETPLEHGSGIGLWIVYWIVEHSDSSISFTSADDGTRVTIDVPRSGSNTVRSVCGSERARVGASQRREPRRRE